MKFSLSGLHTHDDVIHFVTGYVKCSKLIDVNSKNLKKPQIFKEVHEIRLHYNYLLFAMTLTTIIEETTELWNIGNL